MLYTLFKAKDEHMAIKSFTHKGLKNLFYKGDSSGVQPIHATKLEIMPDTINASHQPKRFKGYLRH